MRTIFNIQIVIALLSYSCKRTDNFIVIKNTNLFDGENYNTHVNIVIKGDRIIDISKDKNWPENCEIINGEGKTIIPPLLNAHIHAWRKENLKEAQASGIFALFDMHNTDASANSLRYYHDFIDYAFYYSSGPGATVPGGHGTEYGVQVPTIDSAIGPEKFVEDRIKNHADYIKIFREPSMPTLNFEQTRRVIKASHKNSKLCVAHASRLSDALMLSSQNIDGLVHIWFDKTINKEQLDGLSETKIFMVPTLLVTKHLLDLARREKWKIPLITEEELLNEVKKIHTNGIPILAGTDAPNFDFNYGNAYFKELKLLYKAGLPAIEVLKAGTSNIYKSFKIKEFKKMEKGSTASFILINGIVTDNFDCIDKVEGIWKNGKRIK